ncbi:conserved hypothetical protein [Vibrio nigripulchritudo SFn27]|uniref:Competence protein J (ComJ) n=1 Tax=Vibrio nigripulchritudo TaxID=28173 RepID=A0A9P1JL69_9VIBR|nr:competence protein ComJ [Vibrio nigripulchritudo]CBJ93085.1 Conserved hypothetical protein [Vibrio nigripulchritudo]CCN38630.1 conserved hypothetical protein [Vibrio nigripulchritudo AM115]CCN44939.1 conserved hypothetical protein [Vibrio nigripulchritudo FTn2]CCN79694.1 conserved hypothetical protein [Vibrio nigripulchritudo SO65]CCN85899.1 conserved hypothetical protein [Vibrio nigripulchritudo BLFn1]
MSQHRTLDLLISHQQIRLENRPFESAYCQWGAGNLLQGCIVHDGFVVFDPIVQGSFGAYVQVTIATEFHQDANNQRCIAVPFSYTPSHPLSVSSAFEKHTLDWQLEPGGYQLVFEIVEKDEEVQYKITLVPMQESAIKSEFLKDDDFGAVRKQKIRLGTTDEC